VSRNNNKIQARTTPPQKNQPFIKTSSVILEDDWVHYWYWSKPNMVVNGVDDARS